MQMMRPLQVTSIGGTTLGIQNNWIRKALVIISLILKLTSH